MIVRLDLAVQQQFAAFLQLLQFALVLCICLIVTVMSDIEFYYPPFFMCMNVHYF